MVELLQRYDLRPHPGNTKPASTYPSKKVVPTKRAPKANVALEVPTTQTVPHKPHATPHGTKAQPEVKEPEKIIPPFNLEQELHKIKIQVPLSELAQNPIYHPQLQTFLQASSSNVDQDAINMQDEHPTIILGTHVENRYDSVPPFFVTLIVHDKLLHN